MKPKAAWTSVLGAAKPFAVRRLTIKISSQAAFGPIGKFILLQVCQNATRKSLFTCSSGSSCPVAFKSMLKSKSCSFVRESM